MLLMPHISPLPIAPMRNFDLQFETKAIPVSLFLFQSEIRDARHEVRTIMEASHPYSIAGAITALWTYTRMIASTRLLDPPDNSEVDASGHPDRPRQALNESLAPLGQAAVAVEPAGRLLRHDRQAGCNHLARSGAAALRESSSKSTLRRAAGIAQRHLRDTCQRHGCNSMEAATVSPLPLQA